MHPLPPLYMVSEDKEEMGWVEPELEVEIDGDGEWVGVLKRKIILRLVRVSIWARTTVNCLHELL